MIASELQDEERPVPKRKRRLVAGVVGTVVVAAIIAAAVGGRNTSGSAPQATRPAPTFDLENLRRQERRITLTDLRGRPVVVNFFASWCVPCRQEMTAFEKVHRQLGDRVAFLGIDTKDSRTDGLDLLSTTGVDYPAAYDPSGATASAYGLFGMPTTVLIDKTGRIRGRHTGRMTAADLTSAVRDAFDVNLDASSATGRRPDRPPL